MIVISSVEVFATIPVATFFIVSDAKAGFIPWKSWADTHNHYSVVYQVPGFVWRNIPGAALGLEVYRWALVASAFIFFSLFGFAAEAREQYYRLYKLLARLVSTSSALHGAPHAYVVRSLCRSVLIHWGSYYYYFAVLHQSLMWRETVASRIGIRTV